MWFTLNVSIYEYIQNIFFHIIKIYKLYILRKKSSGKKNSECVLAIFKSISSF